MDELVYCVYLYDGDKDSYIPISYGDDSLECEMWLKDHSSFYPKGTHFYIGASIVLSPLNN